MGETISATELRRNIYRILDEVLETGAPRYVSRHGRILMLVEASPGRRRFGDGPRRKATALSLDELAKVSWADEWSAEDTA